jgi:hypothetical protein
MLHRNQFLALLFFFLLAAMLPFQRATASCLSQVCTPTPGPTSASSGSGNSKKKAHPSATTVVQRIVLPTGTQTATASPTPTLTALIIDPTATFTPIIITPTASASPSASAQPAQTQVAAPGLSGAITLPGAPTRPGQLLGFLLPLALLALLGIIGGTAFVWRGMKKNGRIVILDQKKKVDFEKEFHDALIDEIGFPGPDECGSKDSGENTINAVSTPQPVKKLGKD